MVAQLSIVSNETFTYKQAMKEKDFNDFVLTMVHEVDDHEKRGHWTIMQCCDMPADSKTIMSIWSFNSLNAKSVLAGEKLVATYSIST